MIDKYAMAKTRQNTVSPEQLTFGHKTAQGVFTSYTLYNCQRSAVTKTVNDTGKLVQVQTVKFRVHQTDLDYVQAPEPKVNDIVTDEGGLIYTIHGVTPRLRGQVFVLDDCQLRPS